MTQLKKAALITGASRGIGLAIARELAALGYSLGIVSRSQTDINTTADSLRTEHPGVEIITGAFDIADDSKITRFVGDVIERLEGLSVMVNNAGELHQGTSQVSPETLRRLVEVNLVAATVFAQAVIPAMKSARSGLIVNVASICGVEAYPEVGAYCASKFGLVAYSHALDQELAPYGIKVTALCPSWVNTRLSAHSTVKREEMIQPEDLGATVRYLLSLSAGARVRELVIHC